MTTVATPFKIRTDEGTISIKFDPYDHKTAAAAAKAFHRALKPLVRAHGQNPDIELSLLTPAQAAAQGYERHWWVIWEAGPWDWGVIASLTGLWNREAGWYTEPHWGFDVYFVED